MNYCAFLLAKNVRKTSERGNNLGSSLKNRATKREKVIKTSCSGKGNKRKRLKYRIYVNRTPLDTFWVHGGHFLKKIVQKYFNFLTTFH